MSPQDTLERFRAAVRKAVTQAHAAGVPTWHLDRERRPVRYDPDGHKWLVDWGTQQVIPRHRRGFRPISGPFQPRARQGQVGVAFDAGPNRAAAIVLMLAAAGAAMASFFT